MYSKYLSLGVSVLALAQASFGLSMVKREPNHHHHVRYMGEVGNEQPITTTTVVEYYTVNQYGQFLGSSFQTSVPEVPAAEQENTPAPFATDYLRTRSEDGSKSSTQGGGEFPDGEISCSEFPSQYGALALDYLKLGGWSGIQAGNAAGSSCTDGAYCSYACPPGQIKTQWPDDQPADGQTRGGLKCQGGKLHLTRGSVKSLCTEGVPSAYLVNELSEDVAVCATDYPGSENMVLPFVVSKGGQTPLSVTDSATCFTWQSKKTSVQYYVNTAGVSGQKGCQWGSPDEKLGNWAPLNFGAGCDGGKCYFSLSPNPLSSFKNPGYNVRIEADAGSEMNGKCSFENGVFKNENGVSADGCTVCVTKGRAKYVFSS